MWVNADPGKAEFEKTSIIGNSLKLPTRRFWKNASMRWRFLAIPVEKRQPGGVLLLDGSTGVIGIGLTIFPDFPMGETVFH